MSESLSTLCGDGVEMSVAGKTLRVRPLTVGQLGEMEAHCRAKALRALNIALAGDDSMSAAEKRNLRMSLALEPIAPEDMLPTTGDAKTECPECDAGSSVVNGDPIRRRCVRGECGHEFVPTVSVKNVDIAMRAFWLMIKNDTDPDLATFEGFERWRTKLTPDDWASMNATMAGLNGQEPGDDVVDPTAETPNGQST